MGMAIELSTSRYRRSLVQLARRVTRARCRASTAFAGGAGLKPQTHPELPTRRSSRPTLQLITAWKLLLTLFTLPPCRCQEPPANPARACRRRHAQADEHVDPELRAKMCAVALRGMDHLLLDGRNRELALREQIECDGHPLGWCSSGGGSGAVGAVGVGGTATGGTSTGGAIANCPAASSCCGRHGSHGHFQDHGAAAWG